MLTVRRRGSKKVPLPSPALARSPRDVPAVCSRCGVTLLGRPRYSRHRVCDTCGHHHRRGARETIAGLTDEGSFQEAARLLVSGDPLEFVDTVPYPRRLLEQQRQSGETEALVTGEATIHGFPVVIAVFEFGFLGGSMGVVAGEKIARAADRARRERWPLVTIAASGGARMQEGTLSLLQMAKTVSAVTRLQEEGLPYLSVLTNPTTGGVLASFASLGDIIVAEPEALISFAGPRVAEQVPGAAAPAATMHAEYLRDRGIVDGIVPRPQLRAYLGSLLEILAAPRCYGGDRQRAESAAVPMAPAPAAGAAVQAARASERPTSLDYLDRVLDRFVELRGDRMSGDDPAVVTGLGLLNSSPVAVAAFERGRGEERQRRRQGRALPEGYRKARRVMGLAARLKMPVVTLIDTPGAYPGVEAQERGLAGEIARSIAMMIDLPTPTVSVVVGEAGSGGALALAVADRVLMQQRTIYPVIAPEAAAAILFRDAGRAPELANRLKVTATDQVELGVADAIVPEPPGGAAANPEAAAMLVKRAVQDALADLQAVPLDRIVAERARRYRHIGDQHVREINPPRPRRGAGRRRGSPASRLTEAR